VAELKTKRTGESVDAFLAAIADEERRQDCLAVAEMMGRITGAKPEMWGASVVGFGTYHYKYASGREGEWFLVGFSPRKRDLSLYLMSGFTDYDGLLSRLGKFRTGVGCLYVKRLADVDRGVLEELVTASVAHLRQTSV